jgi:hypothetical protein
MAISAHEKLSRIRQTAPLADIVALSPSQQWVDLLRKPDAASVEEFKKRYSGYIEAADAGRWLARNSGSPSAARSVNKDKIYGRWQTADGRLSLSIRPDGRGGQIWHDQTAKSVTPPADIFAETRVDESGKWSYIGRHTWGSTGDATRTWGEANAMVVDLLENDGLFYAFLDSSYRGGWTLKRMQGE